MCVCLYASMHLCLCLDASMCACMCVYVRMYLALCAYVCLWMCVYVSKCLCICFMHVWCRSTHLYPYPTLDTSIHPCIHASALRLYPTQIVDQSGTTRESIDHYSRLASDISHLGKLSFLPPRLLSSPLPPSSPL